ncbi:hypothetical protein MMC22_011195 [Lobaria immixta]|nr:hypothetical protein [Lobaria immixta]
MTTESVCLCGLNRISFAGEPITKRRLTGNGFSNNLLMSTDDLKVLSGSLKTNARQANNGNIITTHFCGDCRSLLYRTTNGYPGKMVIKAGCIDDDGKTNAGFVPKVEIFTRSRVPWMAPVEGAKQEIANFTSF